MSTIKDVKTAEKAMTEAPRGAKDLIPNNSPPRQIVVCTAISLLS
jgi:hypothetical protein